MIARNLRIVFMGTPAFAVPSLQYLVEAGYPIVGVVTAPDKMGGRGLNQVIVSPVKQFALDHQLVVLQPANLKSTEFLKELKSLNADLQVVVAFRMLPEVVWKMSPRGTINLHASLLPAYRGAAPIQWAIIRGEQKTGLTTFLLQHEIDTGHILLQREIPILEDDNAGDLHDRMMPIGAALIVATVDQICAGTSSPRPQETQESSYAPKINHEDGHIDWNKTSIEVYNLIRGMSPSPGAWTILDGKVLKVWKASTHDSKGDHSPGKIQVENNSLFVQALNGLVELREVQMEGKKRMPGRDFINGYKIRNWSLT